MNLAEVERELIKIKSMNIYIDLDHTVIDYRHILNRVILRLGGAPKSTSGSSKNWIKQYINNRYDKPRADFYWKKFQGVLYGKYIHQAHISKSFLSFYDLYKSQIVFVSHKTVRPYEGEGFDLRKRCLMFLSENGVDVSQVRFFEEHRKKVGFINQQADSIVVDDLMSVLCDLERNRFIRVHFNEAENLSDDETFKTTNWMAIKNIMELLQGLENHITKINLLSSSNNLVFKLKAAQKEYVLKLLRSLGLKDLSDKHKKDMVNRMIQNYDLRTPRLFKSNSAGELQEFLQAERVRNLQQLSMRKFERELSKMLRTAGDNEFPLAPEAICRPFDIVDMVENKFCHLQKTYEGNTELVSIENILNDKVSDYKNWLSCDQNLGCWDDILNCLCFSDFSLENLLISNGETYFIDVEHIGRDDPAKMILNLLYHPGVNLRPDEKSVMLKSFLNVFGGEKLYCRLRGLNILWQTLWLLIVAKRYFRATKMNLKSPAHDLYLEIKTSILKAEDQSHWHSAFNL